MKILVDVDDINDVGKKENRRYIINEYQTELIGNGKNYKITGIMEEVRPAWLPRSQAP